MLNCTNLECVFYHHHFYANLHHLKRHLDGHHHEHDEEGELIYFSTHIIFFLKNWKVKHSLFNSQFGLFIFLCQKSLFLVKT